MELKDGEKHYQANTTQRRAVDVTGTRASGALEGEQQRQRY